MPPFRPLLTSEWGYPQGGGAWSIDGEVLAVTEAERTGAWQHLTVLWRAVITWGAFGSYLLSCPPVEHPGSSQCA